MAGTWAKPSRKSAGSITEFLQLARLAADSALTESTSAHRDDGFQNAEPADPAEFSYMMQRMWQWFRRTGASLQIDHRAATVTIGGGVTIGDTRRVSWTFPAAFHVDYVTDASDTTNDDIAEHFAAAINADATASAYVVASAAGAVVTLDMIEGGAAVTWSVSQPVVVGAPTTVLADLNTDTTLCVRVSDDDSFSALNFLIGSSSMEDIGATGDYRLMFDIAKGAFRAGVVNSTQWDNASRGNASAALNTNCTASGADSLAFGNASTASGTQAVAGGNCTASGTYAISLGLNCTATQQSAVSVGLGATATGVLALAMVSGQSSGVGSIAIGTTGSGAVTCDSSGEASIAMGSGPKATADFAVALGLKPQATAASAVALGRFARGTHEAALELGYDYDGVAPNTDLGASGRSIVVRNLTAVGPGAKTSTYTPTDETSCLIRIRVLAFGISTVAHVAFETVDVVCTRTGGVLTLHSTPTVTTLYDDTGAGLVCTVTAVATEITVTLTYAALGALDEMRYTVTYEVDRVRID